MTGPAIRLVIAAILLAGLGVACDKKPRGQCIVGSGISASCIDAHSGECEVANGRFRAGITCSGQPIGSTLLEPSW